MRGRDDQQGSIFSYVSAEERIPAEHPLRAVVHAAGVLDDATVESMSEVQLCRVLAPQVAGAVHLHELTRGMGLAAFVLMEVLSPCG